MTKSYCQTYIHNDQQYSISRNHLYINRKQYPIYDVIRQINKIRKYIHPPTRLTYSETRDNYKKGILDARIDFLKRIYIKYNWIYYDFSDDFEPIVSIMLLTYLMIR